MRKNNNEQGGKRPWGYDGHDPGPIFEEGRGHLIAGSVCCLANCQVFSCTNDVLSKEVELR